MSLKTINDTSNTSDSDTLIHTDETDESDPCSSQSIQLSELNTISRDKPRSSESISMATILDGTFFKLVSSDSKNVIATCVKCEPKNVNIKGSKYSSSNFKSHLKRKHDNLVLEEYEKYINEVRKSKKTKFEESNMEIINCKNKNKMIKYSQNQFDEDIVNYIIHAMAPLRTVENHFFKTIFINSGVLEKNSLNLISRRSLGRRIETRFEQNIEDVKNTLEKVKYLCTTADVWSAKKRSFMGVTVHWIDEESLGRKTAILACRRFRGAHTHDRIADILHNIYYKYNLDVNKVNGKHKDNRRNNIIYNI